jgi:transglutaminase-like putative cysteine protease
MNLQKTIFYIIMSRSMSRLIQYKVFHETVFDYSVPVSFSHNVAKLQPVDNDIQILRQYSLHVTPQADSTSQFVDYFGNATTQLFIKESHKKLCVVAKSLVDLDVKKIEMRNASYESIYITRNQLTKHLKSSFNDEVLFLKQYLFPSQLIGYPNERIISYAKKSFDRYDNVYLAVKDFIQRIFNDFEFVSGFSEISTPISVIFEEKKGVCQDFASLSIASLRALGIPTRYASGYILTYPSKGKEKLFGVDASHAWISVYLGKHGWVDFDPTNNKIPNEEYILLGYGRDYNDITPLKGVVQGSGISKLNVRVDIRENI